MASSEGIADEVARRYGVRRPTVVHNVFPTEAARGAGLESARDGSPGLSLYWYSQVIGAGRGLEDAVIALSMLPEPASLHLRGESDPQFVPRLLALAAERGVRDRVHLLPPAPADELVALAAQHDVGLALEIPDTLNRALCVTNKLFTYLAAGVAVAATDTPGQRRIIEQCDDAGFLYPPGDAAALAAGIARWAESRERLAAAREDARRSALERFSWERERLALLAAVVGDSSRVAAIA
jgi:glycosyltransferase involved in cell wall biosynthesis